MKIAITGGSGFLGKYVIECIKNNDHIPVVLTREDSRDIADVQYQNTNYTMNDLINKLNGVDALVHLAAKRGSQGLISEFHDNEVLTQNLYDACYELGINNIIFASTISIYTNLDDLPWKESSVPRPELMYGISKLACEHIGNIYSSNKSMYIKNLRFAHLFGFNEKNNYMINKFLRQAYNKEQLVLDSVSVARREFLYAKDAANAIMCALNKSTISGTYNIGSGEALTNYEVADIINQVFGNKENILVNDTELNESIKSSLMDSKVSKEVFGNYTKYSFYNAVSEIYLLMKELKYVPILY